MYEECIFNRISDRTGTLLQEEARLFPKQEKNMIALLRNFVVFV